MAIRLKSEKGRNQRRKKKINKQADKHAAVSPTNLFANYVKNELRP